MLLMNHGHTHGFILDVVLRSCKSVGCTEYYQCDYILLFVNKLMSVLDNVGSYARSLILNLLSKLDYMTIMSTSSCLFTIFPDQNCAVS